MMKGLLKKDGFEIVELGDSDVAVLNTCYVKSVTEQRIFFRIKDIQNRFPEKKLIVAGCIPSAAPGRIRKIAPNASLISTHQITKIVKAVNESLKGKRVEYLDKGEDKILIPKVRFNPLIDIVPIESGCTGSCSFCSTRLAKGFVKSYPKGKIVEQIRNSLEEGCKEFWLTGQDTGSYGLDRGVRTLPDLLNKIIEIEEEFFLRIGMLNPNHAVLMLNDLISSYKSNKIYKFLHIPVQSGDNEILKRMIRVYEVEDFENVVERFRKAFERFQIWTDVIVAFPGETEEQFENTIKLLERTKPDYVNISRYAKRPETAAAKLKQLPTEIAKERSRIATEISRKISLERNKEWINWHGDILITEKGRKENQFIGRNFAYKPVLIESKENVLGRILRVNVVDASSVNLSGKL
jgi:MiaB-like tRNA modifying enzyme